ncbi:hypothetical protein KIN20_025073 [Parelaphostrongylus tenuis]|uniref:Uncharacterized protein n=1 Tax=Parelaphostrongylus tenuis TaxID=148309 RepID=A0AAD5QWP3_PARTN|nr:hypothetical protein KIN20_025073 [Parelaphostrongylus tenuis]
MNWLLKGNNVDSLTFADGDINSTDSYTYIPEDISNLLLVCQFDDAALILDLLHRLFSRDLNGQKLSLSIW